MKERVERMRKEQGQCKRKPGGYKTRGAGIEGSVKKEMEQRNTIQTESETWMQFAEESEVWG